LRPPHRDGRESEALDEIAANATSLAANPATEPRVESRDGGNEDFIFDMLA
jgi:hypothetical protein